MIPEGKPTPELMKKLDEQDPESAPRKLNIQERQKLLMQLLWQEGGLDQLDQWMPEWTQKFEQMLMEYHDVFSLDKNGIRCTDAAEHIIELLDEEPFKERFWQIAPPLLDEVWGHLQEIWTVELSGPHNRLGVMLWFWSGRRMWDYGSASTSSDSMPVPRKTVIPYHRCKKQWSPWLEPGSSPRWI